MRHERRPKLRTVLGAAVVVLVSGAAAACGDGGTSRANDEASGTQVDERAARDGEVCPTRLPRADDGSHGFGTSEPAEESPSLAKPDEAWVCQYDPVDVGPGPGGDGTVGWLRTGNARPVGEERLDALASRVAQLEPADDERVCTADLGPRWMVVLSSAGDLTGVVVDGYGCGEVRLTDEPFETVPGEGAQGGAVAGVLDGGADLLDAVKVERAAR